MSLFSLLLSFLGCSRETSEHSDEKDLPEITAKIGDEFQDIVLAITDVSVDSTGKYKITASGKFQGKIVGLGLVVRGNMLPGVNPNPKDDKDYFNKDAIYGEGIIFESIGPPSNELVTAIANLYGIKVSQPKMKEKVGFTTIALKGDPRNIKLEMVHFKLFHDEEDEDGEYSELYVDFDIPDGAVVILEKDMDFREGIIKALSKTN